MNYNSNTSIQTLIEKMNKLQDRELSKAKICAKCGAIFTTKTKIDRCYACKVREVKDPKVKSKK